MGTRSRAVRVGGGADSRVPLAVAAEYLADLGDFDEAKSVLREIPTHPGCGPFDGYVQLVEIALSEGNLVEARALSGELRHSDAYDYVLTTRFRIRRAAGMPWDVMDHGNVCSQEIFGLDPPA